MRKTSYLFPPTKDSSSYHKSQCQIPFFSFHKATLKITSFIYASRHPKSSRCTSVSSKRTELGDGGGNAKCKSKMAPGPSSQVAPTQCFCCLATGIPEDYLRLWQGARQSQLVGPHCGSVML